MAMKEQQRQIYRTARGTQIDMNKLVTQNEMTVAVGNAKVNARGDKLGAKGEIIKTREEILREQESAKTIPNQINVRTEDKPVQVAAVSKTVKTLPMKDVVGMDPEGKE